MTTVTVYSTPNCMQCKMTYRELDRKGIEYKVVDLADETNAAARTWITEDLHYSSAPIVVDDNDDQNHWAGFRPDLISQLV